jgi:hypothetical protein
MRASESRHPRVKSTNGLYSRALSQNTATLAIECRVVSQSGTLIDIDHALLLCMFVVHGQSEAMAKFCLRTLGATSM